MLADLDLCGHIVSLEDNISVHNNSSHRFDHIAVLIVAAGRGNRASGDIPKQYRTINGETVLRKTIKCFASFSNIVVVIHPDDQDLFAKATKNLPQNIISVFGGDTRTQSVKAGLNALADISPKHVLIHDAARPFLTQAAINDVVTGLQTHQATAPALPIVDALKTQDGTAIDRDQLVRVQTPQGFDFNAIRKAYAGVSNQDSFADDIAIAKTAGLSIKMCEGDESNIKLTYEHDFMQNTNMVSITGSGYDVHRICAGKTLYLCGVEINAGFSLKGHSDSDVALHALTDAILGAICAGDIGDHFPPSDPKWKDVKSDVFLKHAVDLLHRQNATLDHIDLTLICEQPKIKPHRETMRTHLSKILSLPLSRVSIKATTTEGLGFTGRSEGIAAQAVVSIRVPDDK